ncbi:methyl-accepting chemotaxis protein [Vibrio aquaticus]|uniref:Methyl-accepting chemotaxis protein n=1 Tax=Vibrio aquaticus TaxID=2496559 RepID=A0A432D0Y4_9VIBR|nr:methyl-accepting chemotaxis protein [Vibrio aquaticus]RTZ17528.1 methyl-accepting chemotaxis protein [Vibrio aquaticus]
MKLTISGKLQLSFLSLAVLFIVSAFFTYRSISTVETQTASLLDRDLPTVDAGRTLQQSVQATVSSLRAYMLLGGEESLQQTQQDNLTQAIDRVEILLISLEELVVEQNYQEIVAKWGVVSQSLSEISEMSHSEENLPAHSLFINEAAPIAEVALDQIQGLINDEASNTEGGERKRLFRLYADSYTSFANALSSMRDFLLYGKQEHLDKYQDFLKAHAKPVAEIDSKIELLSSSDQGLWSLFKEMQQLYFPLAEQVVELRRSADWNIANQKMANELVPAVADLNQSLEAVISKQQANADRSGQGIFTSVKNVITLLVGSIAVVVVIAVSTAHLMGKSIGRRVATISKRAESIADGDVSQPRLPVEGSDELASLTQSINKMNDELASIVKGVTSKANNVSDSMSELLNANAQTVTQVESQKTTMELVGQQVNDVSQSANETAHQAEQSASYLKESKHQIELGSQALDQNKTTVGLLHNTIENASVQVDTLSKESEAIGRVTEVIEGLAEQTNLLALNAAIEAARAGEYGRGFAVVADEVRMLATRTTESTTEINNIVNAIQSSTKAVVQEIDKSKALAEEGADHTEKAYGTLSSTTEQIEVLNQKMHDLLASAQHQSSATDAIESLMGQVIESVDGVAEISNSSAQISSQVRGQVEELNAEMAQFKTDQS